MKPRLSMLVMGCLLLGSCVSTDGVPNFERMSYAELTAYNSGRPLPQMIVCTEDPRSFSRVRRRYCGTVESIYGSNAQLDRLSVLHQGQGLSASP